LHAFLNLVDLCITYLSPHRHLIYRDTASASNGQSESPAFALSDIREIDLSLSNTAGRPEKGTAKVILNSCCFTFLAAYADADAEPTKPLTTTRDEAMAMAKRAATILVLDIMFDDVDYAIFFKKYE
jgi:hypothetical protein